MKGPDPVPTSTHDADDANEPARDDPGRLALFWALWGGLLFAVVGESLLFLLADAGAPPSNASVGLATAHVAVAGGFATLAAGMAVGSYSLSLGGGGLTTALICWMLLKSIAITGLVTHQLGGELLVVIPFFAVFAVGMAGLNPTAFEGV